MNQPHYYLVPSKENYGLLLTYFSCLTGEVGETKPFGTHIKPDTEFFECDENDQERILYWLRHKKPEVYMNLLKIIWDDPVPYLIVSWVGKEISKNRSMNRSKTHHLEYSSLIIRIERLIRIYFPGYRLYLYLLAGGICLVISLLSSGCITGYTSSNLSLISHTGQDSILLKDGAFKWFTTPMTDIRSKKTLTIHELISAGKPVIIHHLCGLVSGLHYTVGRDNPAIIRLSRRVYYARD